MSAHQIMKILIFQTARPINQQLKAYEKWDKESIEDRQKILLGLSKNIWKIELVP